CARSSVGSATVFPTYELDSW
nr:immunoglobulin heavy chain junction region [Macaca mulatta]MOV48179.1 immunoglobulin heavy chain junction region [Macaca mulatta]MOV48709.1 immunoglobulin heavy chain junction region [Macaca mulatta]